MKRFLKSAAKSTGLLGLVSRFAPGQVSTFSYYGFRPAGPSRSPLESKLMPVNQFESQLRVFRRYGVPTRLGDLLKPDADLSGRRVVITIDDGYASVYHYAFPILKKYNWPATLFLPTGFLDRETTLWPDWLEYMVWNAPDVNPAFRWNGSTIPLALYSNRLRSAFVNHHKAILKTVPVAEAHEWLKAFERHIGVKYGWGSIPEPLRPLTWEQVREMRESGLITIGSHTVTHPILASCPMPDQEAELRESKRRIEVVLNEPCRFFAYPNGLLSDFTTETESAVRRAGYSLAVTMESGFSTDPPVSPFRLRRWGAGIPTADLAYLVSGAGSFSAS